MAGEGVALFGRPGLLVAGLAAVVLRQRRHRTRPLRVVGLKISLVDAPATPRRDIAVIVLYRVLLESSISTEMPTVLPEDTFIEIVEGGLPVDIVGGDPGPVVGAAVAGGPLGEPLELACSVTSVVPAVATAAFSLVLEVALEGTLE